MLILATMQPSPRPEVLRLAQLIQASARGTYIRLKPLTVAEVRDCMSAALSLPVGDEAASLAHRHTDGFPTFLRRVVDQLARTPLGTRGLSEAVRRAKAEASFGSLLSDVAAALEIPAPESRPLLHILAAAGGPLSIRELEQLCGRPVEAPELMSTGLVSWDSSRLTYSLEYGLIGDALLTELSLDEQAEHHHRIAGISSDPLRLHHQARASRLRDDPEAGELTHQQLLAWAQHAAQDGRTEQALKHALLANALSTTEESLRLLSELLGMTGDNQQLSVFEGSIRTLPCSALRAGLSALLALGRNDPDAALLALEQHGRVAPEDHALPLFARALSETASHLVLRDGTAPSTMLLSRTLDALSAREQVLRRDGEASAQSTAPLMSLQAQLRMWALFNHEDPSDPLSMIERISGRCRGQRRLSVC